MTKNFIPNIPWCLKRSLSHRCYIKINPKEINEKVDDLDFQQFLFHTDPVWLGFVDTPDYPGPLYAETRQEPNLGDGTNR